MSLERALSKLGFASRSEARALIVEGRVSINAHPEAPESITVTNTSSTPLDLTYYEI